MIMSGTRDILTVIHEARELAIKNGIKARYIIFGPQKMISLVEYLCHCDSEHIDKFMDNSTVPARILGMKIYGSRNPGIVITAIDPNA